MNGAARWLRAAVDDCSSRRGIAPLMVGAFTVAYFVATGFLARLKPFSLDELDVYNIARLPSAADVWRAWFESGDGMPPSVHLATHLVASALGLSEITARLPPMAGFWLMCVCVFIFLCRRGSPLLAAAGMLLPVTVPQAYFYAYEARGYGMAVGFAAATVVCWDLVRDARWRRVALFALPICLTAAVASHLYAILVVVPLGLAELARSMERRRVDWWVWIGLVAPGLILLPANPVIAHIRGLREVALRSHRVSVSELMNVWSEFLSTPATYLGLLAIVALCQSRAFAAPRAPEPAVEDAPPAPSDWVLALALAATPAIGWLVANLVTGNFMFRYVIVAVIGFSLAIPLLCGAVASRRPEVALLVAAWVALSAAGSTAAAVYAMRTTALTTEHIAAGRGCFRLFTVWGKLPHDGLPIVVSDFVVFHQLHHYAPEALRRRLVFVVDREFGELIEPVVPFYARVFGERMDGLDGFLQSNPEFYLYDCGAPARLPLVERLLGAGASVRDSGLADTPDIGLRRELYRVSLAGG